MAFLISKRGRKRWKGIVQVNYIQKSRLFSDDSTESHQQALEWEQKTKDHLRLNGDDLTIGIWIMTFLEDMEEAISYKAYRQYKAILYRFFNFIKNIPVYKISIPKVRAYLMAEKKRGQARNEDIRILKRAWNWGSENIPYFPDKKNPFESIKKYPQVCRFRHVPTEKDFVEVLRVADEQEQAVLLFVYETAARPVEAFRLKFSDIDFEANRIFLWSKKGKNHNLSGIWVPMSERLKKKLEPFVKKRKKQNQRRCAAAWDKQHLFISAYHTTLGKPIRDFRYFLNNLCIEAGVKNFGLYGLRHLRAANEYRQTKSILKVQRLLRHKKPSTTDFYLRSLGLNMDN